MQRFWNHQWRKNRDGILLEIWHALYRRRGCLQVMRKEMNNRYVPPDPNQIPEGKSKPCSSTESQVMKGLLLEYFMQLSTRFSNARPVILPPTKGALG